MKKYINRVLVAIDQLGNAICGGNEDSTISARVGYFNTTEIGIDQSGSLRLYWDFMERVINFAFEPLDGPGHCEQAYVADNQETFIEGSDAARAGLGIVVIFACAVISVFTWAYHYYKKYIDDE